MLTRPAKSRGMMDSVPFRSSILSMIKIAMIDVNAIVIYIPSPNKTIMSKSTQKRNFFFFNPKVNGKNKIHRQSIPNKTSIIWLQVVVRRPKSNSSNTYIKTCPAAKLTLQAVICVQEFVNNQYKQI